MDISFAKNGVEAGIYKAFSMLSEGRIKVFKSLRMWQDEFAVYRRDKHGKVVKENDHLMDAFRYLITGDFKYGYAEDKHKVVDEFAGFMRHLTGRLK